MVKGLMMARKIIAGLVIFLSLTVSGWLIPLKARALTNEGKIQMLRDRFIKGELSGETYKRLLKKYREGTTQLSGNHQLILRMYSEKIWKNVVIGCDKLSTADKMPLKVGCFISNDPSGALKIYIRFKDKDGEIFQSLFMMGVVIKSPGETIEVTIPSEKLKYVMGCGVAENLLPDLPITVDSFLITNRKPFSQTLVIDNITLNGKLIEDFDSGHNWETREISPEFHCKFITGNAEEKVSAFLSPDKLILKGRPTVYSNLIENGTYFRDEDKNGIPDSWYMSKAKYMPRDTDGNIFNSPKTFSGTCEVEERGIEGLPCITIKGDKNKCGIDTVVEKIRPYTPYTISFWCRQSKEGSLNVFLFGRRLIPDMFKNNPNHWCRYSETAYSGSYSGDVSIGFHIMSGETVSLGDIRLYEGNSPIGYDSAEIRAHYYTEWYISPDCLSPVNFGVENNFFETPEEIKYIIDLPTEIILSSYWLNYWGNPEYWMQKISLDKKEIERDGKKYIRYCFTYKSPRNPFVRSVYEKDMRTKKRDKWGGTLGNFSSPTNLRIFLSTRLTSQPKGELAGYYHTRWHGGKQLERKVDFKVVRIPEIAKPRHLEIIYIINPVDYTYAPEIIDNYSHTGATGVSFGVSSSGIDRKLVQAVKNSGLQDIGVYTNIPQYHKPKDPKVYGIGLDGKRSTRKLGRGSWPLPGYCLSYRGKDWMETMDRWKSYISAGVNHLIMDDYAYSNCYCEKCKANFKRFLMEYTDIPYKEPESFMRKPGTDPQYESLWKDFQCWLYGMVIMDIKKELQEFADKKGIKSKISIDSSSIPIANNHDFAFDILHKYLGAWTSQYYMNCYWYMSNGDPGALADVIKKNYEKTGKYPVKKSPLLGPGLVYMTATCAIDPPQQHKYQILEALMCCPVTGYSLYSDIELCDFYYSAQANKILFPFEDILIDGKMIDNITAVSETNSSRARGKRLGKEILLLVSDYTTYGSEETSVTVQIPDSPEVLKDVETGEEIRLGDDNTFFVTLKNGRRARLFHGLLVH